MIYLPLNCDWNQIFFSQKLISMIVKYWPNYVVRLNYQRGSLIKAFFLLLGAWELFQSRERESECTARQRLMLMLCKSIRILNLQKVECNNVSSCICNLIKDRRINRLVLISTFEVCFSAVNCTFRSTILRIHRWYGELSSSRRSRELQDISFTCWVFSLTPSLWNSSKVISY